MSQPNVACVEVRAQIQWQFYQDDASRRWIAICEPLKVTVEADTHTELRKNIEDGVNLLFVNLLRDNELDRFMVERGWTIRGPIPDGHQEVRFDVPIELVARHANGLAQRVH